MRQQDQYPYGNGGHDRPAGRFDLFFYERGGERFYLRLTLLAAGLVFGLTLLSITTMVFLFFYNAGRPPTMPDINIRVNHPPATQSPHNLIVMPAKPAPRRPPAGPAARRDAKGDAGRNVSPTPPPDSGATAAPAKTPPNP